ncbi:hypothetical protein JG687_00007306 [Phytophthora cactorum]|uniref:Uncharacterized protein n=1 Tax=Phytophthora cactorum TaxID=29920 RepID=A0A8T1UH07_9STRA|nr:hypothetical protein JG687_00007306 [Phytophthora cactorum]
MSATSEHSSAFAGYAGKSADSSSNRIHELQVAQDHASRRRDPSPSSCWGSPRNSRFTDLQPTSSVPRPSRFRDTCSGRRHDSCRPY